ncbi:MAG: hypothetical protein KJZ59_10500, partial [Pararhodobacter sp.]|nr:hypothetical protein [Pararhodobacter sp.]
APGRRTVDPGNPWAGRQPCAFSEPEQWLDRCWAIEFEALPHDRADSFGASVQRVPLACDDLATRFDLDAEIPAQTRAADIPCDT